MLKSFLQQVSQSVAGSIYGMDLYDLVNRRQVIEKEAKIEGVGTSKDLKALKDDHALR